MNKLKIAAATIGGLFAVAHIGLLGYVIRQPGRQQFIKFQPSIFHAVLHILPTN